MGRVFFFLRMKDPLVFFSLFSTGALPLPPLLVSPKEPTMVESDFFLEWPVGEVGAEAGLLSSPLAGASLLLLDSSMGIEMLATRLTGLLSGLGFSSKNFSRLARTGEGPE